MAILVHTRISRVQQVINIERQQRGVDNEQIDVQRLDKIYGQALIAIVTLDDQSTNGVVFVITLCDRHLVNKAQVVSDNLALLIEVR